MATKAKKKAKKSAKKPAKATEPASAKSAKKSGTVYELGVGDSVPKFSGASTSGKVVNQDVHNMLVLYFYPKDNTPGCTLEGQDFRRLHKQFEKAGAAIVGVSQDSVASHQRFKAKCDFPFELLSDESGEVCKAFDVIHMKSMYGRDFEGIERSTFLIRNGKIAQAWRKVKVADHAQAVLDAVKVL